MKDQRVLFTIGHSTRELNDFIFLLQENEVEVVADVRSSPYSRHMPHFNRENLKAALKQVDIQYVFLGEELGARRDEAECYVDGVAKYELIAQTNLYREGIRRIQNGVTQYRVALMCAEKDPLTCHRTVLIAKSLKQEFDIQHIVSGTEMISQARLEERMLVQWNMTRADFFHDETAQLEEAYRRQGESIAYSIPQEDAEAEPND